MLDYRINICTNLNCLVTCCIYIDACTHIHTHSCTVLENAWRVQDWTAMKEASTQAEPICSENYSARLNLLRGFLALCYPDEQRLSAVEKLIEAASIQGIKQWRRLPKIVSHAHVSLLQVNCCPYMYRSVHTCALTCNCVLRVVLVCMYIHVQCMLLLS